MCIRDRTAYRPTRAEVTDITNAILEGSDAVMLSAETSIGDHPNRAVEVMSTICSETDARNDTSTLRFKELSSIDELTTTLARAAVQVANDIDARAIVAFTESGRTPLLISNYRPKSPIITFTSKSKTYNQMSLLWGVEQYKIDRRNTFEEMLSDANDFLKNEKKYNKGDKVVTMGGIIGTVTGFKEKGKLITLKVDNNTTLTFNKSAIAGLSGKINQDDIA